MLARGRWVRFVRAVLRVGVPLLPMMLVLSASATGCEAIVGSSVPAFTCSDSDPSSCPSGQVCATATGQCIPASTSCLANPCAAGLTCDPGSLQCVSGVVEAGTSDAGNMDSGSNKDTGSVSEGGGPPYAVGHACQKPSDCATTLCADSATLGQDYFNQVGAVCTIPCCTSEQCGAGLVCIGPGTGGKYCVPAAALKRTLGAKPGGTACGAATECRSGKCIGDSMGTNKVCADTCCLDAQCAGTAKCRPVDVEGTTHKSYACSILPGGSTTVCSAPFDSCLSGVCASGSCSPACCGKASVSGAGNNVCTSQNLANGDTFDFSNFSASAGSATGDFGAVCSSDTKCKTGYCDKLDGATMGTCSDVCCTDDDCRPNVCRPRTGMTHFLRCVPQ